MEQQSELMTALHKRLDTLPYIQEQLVQLQQYHDYLQVVYIIMCILYTIICTYCIYYIICTYCILYYMYILYILYYMYILYNYMYILYILYYMYILYIIIYVHTV